MTKRLSAGLFALAAAAGVSSCESINDYEGDCDPHYYVQFVFEKNMLSADAFASQVNSVNLYIFDAATGAFVKEYAEADETVLRQPGYRMAVDLPAGKRYEFVAWCGLAKNEGVFTVPQHVANRSELSCTMARTSIGRAGATAFQDANLNDYAHALFHGRETALMPDSEGEHVVTVYLTKDTNNFNISLHHYGETLNPDDFIVTITDDNGRMDYTNALRADEMIEYRPWSKPRYGEFDTNSGSQESGYMISEIATARLLTDHEMRLSIVEKASGETIFSMPVIRWAREFRSEKYASMDDQEFLDRQDEYALTVFLTGGERWTAVEIVINGWHVMVDDIVM